MAFLRPNSSIQNQILKEGELVECYHYTSNEGKAAILKKKRIRASKTGIYGKYVYLTIKNPHDNSRQEIARNNYVDYGE